MSDIQDWEYTAPFTYRLKVDGGSLYLHRGNANETMSFVPDVDLQRYSAHLRDAYTQGYKNGREDTFNGLEDASTPIS